MRAEGALPRSATRGHMQNKNDKNSKHNNHQLPSNPTIRFQYKKGTKTLTLVQCSLPTTQK